MVDSPTTRNRLRKQQLGTNTNTWGDTKLNEALDVIDQSMDGVLSMALASSADYTLTTTNYSTADEAKRRVLEFTGALEAAVNVIVPSVEHEYNVINACGATLTVKTSAGAGVAIPDGYQARVYCDGSDVYNGSPTLLPGPVTVDGQVKGVAAGTDTTDAVNKTQMETAIATAGLPATAGTLLVSSNDTTAGYLGTKLDVTGSGAASVTPSTTNPGANEQRVFAISVGAVGLTDGGTKTSGFTAAVNTRYTCAFTANGTITFPASATAGDVMLFALGGNYTFTLDPNELKINTSTSNLPVLGNQTLMVVYTGATDGWV